MDDELDPREQMLANLDQQQWEEEERAKCVEAIARVRSGMATVDDAELLDRHNRFR